MKYLETARQRLIDAAAHDLNETMAYDRHCNARKIGEYIYFAAQGFDPSDIDVVDYYGGVEDSPIANKRLIADTGRRWQAIDAMPELSTGEWVTLLSATSAAKGLYQIIGIGHTGRNPKLHLQGLDPDKRLFAKRHEVKRPYLIGQVVENRDQYYTVYELSEDYIALEPLGYDAPAFHSSYHRTQPTRKDITTGQRLPASDLIPVWYKKNWELTSKRPPVVPETKSLKRDALLSVNYKLCWFNLTRFNPDGSQRHKPYYFSAVTLASRARLYALLSRYGFELLTDSDDLELYRYKTP